MDMRVPQSLRAIAFVLAVVLGAAGYARAKDYFSLDLRHAEFAPEPLGPAAQFVPPPAPPPLPVATVREPASSAQAVVETSRRAHLPRVGEATRKPRRNLLNAYASYARPRDRACTAGGICVFDGASGRWRAK
jgi:hypothetical protein